MGMRTTYRAAKIAFFDADSPAGKDSVPQNIVSLASHKYGNIETVKTTLEIPDTVFRRAKSKAAERGIPLRQFVTEAVEDKLKGARGAGQKPWMKHMGKLKDLRKETA